MINRQRMEESEDYRDGVMDGQTYGVLKTLAKVVEFIQDEVDLEND